MLGIIVDSLEEKKPTACCFVLLSVCVLISTSTRTLQGARLVSAWHTFLIRLWSLKVCSDLSQAFYTSSRTFIWLFACGSYCLDPYNEYIDLKSWLFRSYVYQGKEGKFWHRFYPGGWRSYNCFIASYQTFSGNAALTNSLTTNTP